MMVLAVNPDAALQEVSRAREMIVAWGLSLRGQAKVLSIISNMMVLCF